MEQLGPYQLTDVLPSAYGGSIYIGRDEESGAEVCVKTIRTTDADPELMERFYQEARVCGRLSHRNIVSVYRLGEQQGTAFLAMERLQGEDLKQFIDRKGYLPLETKIDIMVQVCEGLVHAHAERVIHRDLKPSNIFLTAGGGAKILDFGIARVQGSTLTETGRPVGTPRYMAPEQAAGQPADEFSDIFSAGVVCYEFITGTHPFPGSNTSPVPARQVSPSLPQRVETAVMRALARNPNERFRSAHEFAQGLREAKAAIVEDRYRLSVSISDLTFRISEIITELKQFQHYECIRSQIENRELDLDGLEPIKSELQTPDSLDHTRFTELHDQLRNMLSSVTTAQSLLREVREFEERQRQKRQVRTPVTPLVGPEPIIEQPQPPPPPPPPPRRPGERCRRCGTVNPVEADRCQNCSTRLRRGPVPPPRPAMPKWPFAIIVTIGVALAGVLYYESINRSATDTQQTQTSTTTPTSTTTTTPSPTVGRAKTARSVSLSSGSALAAGTEVQLVGELPAEPSWSLSRPVQIRTSDDRSGSVSLAALTDVSTASPKFDLWHARESCEDPQGCLERIERLSQNFTDDPTLLFLAEAYMQKAGASFRSATDYDRSARDKAESLLRQITDGSRFQERINRVESRIKEFDSRTKVAIGGPPPPPPPPPGLQNYPALLAEAQSAKDKGDCTMTIELAKRALDKLAVPARQTTGARALQLIEDCTKR